MKPFAGLIADTHLDEDSLSTVVDIFMQFISLLHKLKIKYAIHLGDWFNKRSGQSLLCQLTTKQILNVFEENNIKLFIIPGNHDKTDYGSELSYLHTYNFRSISGSKEYWLNNFHPVLIDMPETLILSECPNLILNFIPYFREHDVYQERLKELENQDLKRNQKNILLTHIGINGARNNDGSSVTNGVPKNCFNQFDLICSGHYHEQQDNYIGSAYQRNFGENRLKGFSILHDNGKLDFVESEYKKYYKFEVDAKDKDKLRTVLKEVEPKLNDSFVRITFTGSEDELNSIDIVSLRKMGVDVKSKNTKELEIDFYAIDEAEIQMFDKGTILKEYLKYTNQHKFTPLLRSQGLKILNQI